jgi:hypothetical protein
VAQAKVFQDLHASPDPERRAVGDDIDDNVATIWQSKPYSVVAAPSPFSCSRR